MKKPAGRQCFIATDRPASRAAIAGARYQGNRVNGARPLFHRHGTAGYLPASGSGSTKRMAFHYLVAAQLDRAGQSVCRVVTARHTTHSPIPGLCRPPNKQDCLGFPRTGPGRPVEPGDDGERMFLPRRPYPDAYAARPGHPVGASVQRKEMERKRRTNSRCADRVARSSRAMTVGADTENRSPDSPGAGMAEKIGGLTPIGYIVVYNMQNTSPIRTPATR